MRKDKVETVYESKFIKVYDLQYEEGKHYFNASRRTKEELLFVQNDESFKQIVPDAVSCAVILRIKGEDHLLLTYEYRYPAGQYLLSVPAGIIDPEDKHTKDPLIKTAIREIKEETGLTVKDSDIIKVLNPALFSTPGMSDETNGIVVAVISVDNLDDLSQTGAVGTEMFNGFEILNKEEAKKILMDGVDKHGIFYSTYTWIALTTFIAGLY